MKLRLALGRIGLACGLGLLGVGAVMAWSASQAGRAEAAAVITVCPSGCDRPTIAAALAAAASGDTIRVASGTYAERLTITTTVTLEGGWDVSFTMRTPGQTTIDAQRAGRAVTILGPISPTLDGLTLTGGDATSEISGTHQGGGAYIQAAGALIVNSVITNNVATTHITETGYGGGVYVASGSVAVSATEILSNVAQAATSGFAEGYGGGVYASGSTTLLHNVIAFNGARYGGTLYGYGGGAWLVNSSARGNQFIGNSASNGGGVATVINSVFDGNLSRGTTGGNFLIEANGASLVANNFVLEANCPTGLYGGNSAVQIVNNTVVGCNTGLYTPNGPLPTVRNNLFYSNTTAIASDGMPVLDYNGFWMNGTDFAVVTGTLTGTNNVFANPLLIAPGAGDYHLGPTSPLRDAGTSVGAPPTDYDGDPRPTGPGVDIGADEYLAKLYLPLVRK